MAGVGRWRQTAVSAHASHDDKTTSKHDQPVHWSSLKGTRMKTLIAMFAAAFIAMLAGCNTMEGAGKDLERGGEKVQDTARDVKRGM